MNNKKLKQLAEAIVAEGKVSKDVEKFLLGKLNKQTLKEFVKFYKNALQKQRVYVTSSTNLPAGSMAEIKSLFKGKDVIINLDESLGAGVKIQQDDIIIDYTFKKYINDTIEKLKN